MMYRVKRTIVTALLAFFPLLAPLALHAGISDGFLLRGSGDNLATDPGSVKCKLFDEDGNKVGNILTTHLEDGNTQHEVRLDDGSKLVAIVKPGQEVVSISPVNADAFPELQDYTGDDRYQILTVSANSYLGINGEYPKAIGAFKGAKSIEVRCVFLIMMGDQGPTVLKCLKCHYFIGF